MNIDEFTNLLAFACLLVALFRARWVALALAPPCLLILARWTGLVDISSASSPWRFGVAIVGITAAMWAGWDGKKAHDMDLDEYNERVSTFHKVFGGPPKGPHGEQIWCETVGRFPFPRALVASIIVFASDCTDIPALLAWKLPGEWVLVPLQILACSAVLFVLLAPERWLAKWA